MLLFFFPFLEKKKSDIRWFSIETVVEEEEEKEKKEKKKGGDDVDDEGETVY